MKLLITGGCGFLGSNLCAFYLSQEAEVIVVDALYRDGSALNLVWLQQQAKGNQFSFIQADLADTEAVMAVFRRHAPFDYICHVGGQVAMTTSLNNPTRDFQTNVLGTFNILEAARSLSSESLIAYSSTNKVYGDLEHLSYLETPTRYLLADYPNGLNESLPLDFSTPYGCSKGSADQYVRDWSRVYGLKTVVFRHSSIFGSRQFASFDQGWIGWFCRKAIEQKQGYMAKQSVTPFTIAGTGKQVRDVLHADDLISLYNLAYENREILNGEIFNIGGGQENSLSLIELFSELAKILGIHPLSYSKTPRRASDQDYFVADISKAKHLLDWKPNISFRQGIESTLNWSDKCLKLV
jgi:CDP-paratose 2-epimerase